MIEPTAMHSRWKLFVVAFSLCGACAQPPPPPPDGDASVPPPRTNEQARDWAGIEALEREAQAIARTTGCTSTSGCRAAPVGNRACGGPRHYIVYCAATTDSVALYQKLDEVSRAENEYNRKYGIVSTCEFRMPPDIVFTAGECRAATP
jgi:hypothetical protein